MNYNSLEVVELIQTSNLMRSSQTSDQKTATIKDLDVIFEHLNTLCPASSFSPRNTLLLDDSYDKTACQPSNHLPVPDFDNGMSFSSARALSTFSVSSSATAAFPDVQHSSPTHGKKERAEKVDRTMLAVVGILDRAGGEDSLVGWMEGRGLFPDLEGGAGRWWEGNQVGVRNVSVGEEQPRGDAHEGDEDGGTEDGMQGEGLADKLETGIATGGGKEKKVSHKKQVHKKKLARAAAAAAKAAESDVHAVRRSSLSYSSGHSPTRPKPWHEHPSLVAFWSQRGVEVLESMGIAVEHGMDLEFLERPRAGEEQRAMRQVEGKRRAAAAAAEGREASGEVKGARERERGTGEDVIEERQPCRRGQESWRG
jgi:hypothetical protein